MTTKTDLADLAGSVEQARQHHHPHLDAELMRRILEIEHEAGADDQAAIKAVEQLIEEAVRREVG